MGWKYFNKDGKILTWNHKPIREWVDDILYPTDNLVARWTFNETLTDEINNVTLTSNSSPVYSDGKIGKCITSGFYLYKNGDPTIYNCFLGRQAYTISMWFKTTNTNQALLVVGPGTNLSYGLMTAISSNGMFYYSRIRFGVSHDALQTTTQYNDNQWHHAVISYDDNIMKMWVDKDDYYTQSSTGYSVERTEFYLGRFNASGVASPIFSGAMDNIYLYNRALTDDEVAQLWNNGNGI